MGLLASPTHAVPYIRVRDTDVLADSSLVVGKITKAFS